MKRTKHIDVLMTVAPGPHGEFIETEDDQGNGVGPDRGLHWMPPKGDDPYWRLRIPATAYGTGSNAVGFLGLVLILATIVAVVWLLTR